MSLRDLLGSLAGCDKVQHWLVTLAPEVCALQPEVKAYNAVVYHNYPTLGVSLEFTQTSNKGGDHERTSLEAIHIYNRHEQHQKYTTSFSSFPRFPIILPQVEESSAPALVLDAATTAKDLVQALGEPTRKGGGNGPTSGSINIWCEWANCGVMVEFGGLESRGQDAWDRGRDAIWKELIIFEPSISS